MNGPATTASTITTTAAIAHFIQVFIPTVWPPTGASVVADATRHDGVTAVKHRPASMVGVTPDDRRPLAGYTIGITGHRRWEEQAEMLSRRGARVVHGPTMATTLLGDLDTTIEATRRAISAPVDTVVFTTGIGVRSWFAAAESLGLDEELRASLARSRVVARGPKAQHAARSVGLDVTWTAPTETNDEVFARLGEEGVAGQRVVVQRDGGAPLFAEALAGARAGRGRRRADLPVAGARGPVTGAPPARGGGRPAGRRDHVHLLLRRPQRVRAVPRPRRVLAALGDSVVATAVGPVTAQALRDHGVTPGARADAGPASARWSTRSPASSPTGRGSSTWAASGGGGRARR